MSRCGCCTPRLVDKDRLSGIDNESGSGDDIPNIQMTKLKDRRVGPIALGGARRTDKDCLTTRNFAA